MAIDVMLVDDHPLMLRGLHALLSSHADVSVVAQVSDATQVTSCLRQMRPQVMVLDLMMPEHNGFDVMANLAQEHSPPRVVVLTMMNESGYVRRALALGAMGYVLKNAASTELLEAVLCVARGEIYLGSGLAGDGYPAPGARDLPPDDDPFNSLTRRELEILRLVADGLTNNEVAVRLAIGVRTVDTHRANVMRKLNLRSHRDLIRLAIARKLIELE